jgi:23S rRNA pseudouridine1911/1915/1917 synthase
MPPRGLRILFEDEHVLVVVKPAGLLTIATEREKTRTAYSILTDHVRRGAARSRERVFIVHRLDRETSGVLVFARTEAAKRRLQDDWGNTSKQYLAVVHGRPERDRGTITSYLAENRAHRVYRTRDRTTGKLARTAYRVTVSNRRYSLLEIDLLTGRKHQIRVQLADLGHPVAGDRRYGDPGERGNLALHARSLTFTHPVSGDRLTFTAEPPAHFGRLMGAPKL